MTATCAWRDDLDSWERCGKDAAYWLLTTCGCHDEGEVSGTVCTGHAAFARSGKAVCSDGLPIVVNEARSLVGA